MTVRDNGKLRRKLRRIDFFFSIKFLSSGSLLLFLNYAALPNQMSSLSSWSLEQSLKLPLRMCCQRTS